MVTFKLEHTKGLTLQATQDIQAMFGIANVAGVVDSASVDRIFWKSYVDHWSWWQITSDGEIGGEECVHVAYVETGLDKDGKRNSGRDSGWSFNMPYKLAPVFCSALVGILKPLPKLDMKRLVFAFLRIGTPDKMVHSDYRVIFIGHNDVQKMIEDAKSGRIWKEYDDARLRAEAGE